MKDIGVKTLCKAIRKSLYSPNNIGSDSLAHIVQISDMATQREAQQEAQSEAQRGAQQEAPPVA